MVDCDEIVLSIAMGRCLGLRAPKRPFGGAHGFPAWPPAEQAWAQDLVRSLPRACRLVPPRAAGVRGEESRVQGPQGTFFFAAASDQCASFFLLGAWGGVTHFFQDVSDHWRWSRE